MRLRLVQSLKQPPPRGTTPVAVSDHGVLIAEEGWEVRGGEGPFNWSARRTAFSCRSLTRILPIAGTWSNRAGWATHGGSTHVGPPPDSSGEEQRDTFGHYILGLPRHPDATGAPADIELLDSQAKEAKTVPGY